MASTFVLSSWNWVIVKSWEVLTFSIECAILRRQEYRLEVMEQCHYDQLLPQNTCKVAGLSGQSSLPREPCLGRGVKGASQSLSNHICVTAKSKAEGWQSLLYHNHLQAVVHETMACYWCYTIWPSYPISSQTLCLSVLWNCGLTHGFEI